MPRSNRPRRSRGNDPRSWGADDDESPRGVYNSSRIETRRGQQWNVQAIAPASATKTYVCPGCSLSITPGTGHVVCWRADGLMGEADDVAGRRHWHTHCWKIGR